MLYDVIVVGGGPSGAMAAKTCSEYGLKVLLIEKKSLPRYKACGGGVSRKALDLIGPVDDLEPKYECFGAKAFDSNLKYVEYKLESPVAILTFRDSFDNLLIQRAKNSGAEVHENERVKEVTINQASVNVKTTKGEYSSKLIIGADGVNGVVARESGLRKKWGKDVSGICIETEITLPDSLIGQFVSDAQLIHFYFTEPWGYGWIFPKGNILSVGIGGLRSKIGKPMESFDKFIHLISKDKAKNADLAQYIGKKHAHLIPVGGFDRNIFGDRVLLAGDAAGFVDPFLGEGIYYSIASGRLAGITASESVECNDFSKKFLSLYKSRCDKDFNSDLKFTLRFADIVYRHIDSLLYLWRVDPELFKMYLLVIKGDYTYKKYSILALMRLPATLFKLMKENMKR